MDQTREAFNTEIIYELLFYIFVLIFTIVGVIFIVANHFYLNDKFSFYFTIIVYFGILPFIALNCYRSYSRHRTIYLIRNNRITPENIEEVI